MARCMTIWNQYVDLLQARAKVSKQYEVDIPAIAEIYDEERYPMGANIIAWLLHVHCGIKIKNEFL